MELRSSAFKSGSDLPSKYACEGLGISPPLSWSGVPSAAKSLALVLEDPDAPDGTFTHWLLYGIPPDVTELDEDVAAKRQLPWGGVQGRNSKGTTGYAAPCPPAGPAHHYYFRLYALKDDLDLPPGMTREKLLNRIEGHIADQTSLLGMHQKG